MEKIDYATEINRLRKEKNAFILAHYYQTGEIQDIADKVGDSLVLAQWAAKTTADILVLCLISVFEMGTGGPTSL